VLIVAPIALLDVNVLIALLDPQHGHHEPAHRWFQANANHGWATCPLTQNALLRILSNPRYPNSPGGPAVVMPLLQGMLSHRDHLFWPDLLSWSADAVLQAERLLHHGQITDTYLLALAVHQAGRLVSFDARLSTLAVPGGEGALCLIPGEP
jgi:toxin-antitoxin system PIN domain toxin